MKLQFNKITLSTYPFKKLIIFLQIQQTIHTSLFLIIKFTIKEFKFLSYIPYLCSLKKKIWKPL